MQDTSVNLFQFATTTRRLSRAVAAVTLLAMACGLGGCAGGVAASSSFAMASNDGPTVTFESIDGPPPQVFERMVNVLDSESKLRSLSIVSRENSAAYRVRSYLAVEVDHGRTVIAWVWDVYDRNQQRALRLSDDLVLRKIAQAGLSGLSAMINGTAPVEPSPPASAPAPAGKRGPAVASASGSGEFSVSALGTGNAPGITVLGYSDH
jgi:hypothetical protein